MNRWTPEQAHAWYDKQPWLVGCNFIPSNAINQLEMWQEETFDPVILERELTWAAKLGFNTLRVYLHDLAWQADPEGFKARMHWFLRLAFERGIRPLFVFFDDCWNDNPRIGLQPAPQPGVHNSGWMRSPGSVATNDPSAWPRLEKYVRDILKTFGQDERVLLWDLYNEPGNSAQDERSLPLLSEVFKWARAENPQQPVTVGIWYGNATLNAFQLESSDIISFHNYNPAENLTEQIAELRKLGRPLICTEWLRRGHSEVAACLPVFKRERVACCNWGLVAGKTNTIFPWGSPAGAPEPALWFHDLLKLDGTPFDAKEVQVFTDLTSP